MNVRSVLNSAAFCLLLGAIAFPHRGSADSGLRPGLQTAEAQEARDESGDSASAGESDKTAEQGSGAPAREGESRVKQAGVEAAIRTQLFLESRLQGAEIHVAVEEDTVTLTGTVRNELQKKIAHELVQDVARTEAIVNELSVSQGLKVEILGTIMVWSTVITAALVALLFWLHRKHREEDVVLHEREDELIFHGGDPAYLPDDLQADVEIEKRK